MYMEECRVDLNKLINISGNTISEEDNLKSALEQLGKVIIKVLLVVDAEECFVATLTDGDVRRAILTGASLETEVSRISNYHPMFLEVDDKVAAERILFEKKVIALPVLDAARKIQKVYITGKEQKNDEIPPMDIPVVVMAGGLGTRLYPYTKILPKPLVPISDIPISERIIQSFQRIGCEEFYMVLNYKKNMIKAYFNDLDKVYKIHFIEEDVPLGTGGGLSLIKEYISDTFVLTNCDILIMDDVRSIVQHHKEAQNKVTIVCSLKNFEIPYGIVNFAEGGEIESFVEKPTMSFFTNTGYYICEKEIFDYVSYNEKIGMPDIVDRMRLDGSKIGIYPISENAWLDMGQFDSMESMERRLKTLEVN